MSSFYDDLQMNWKGFQSIDRLFKEIFTNSHEFDTEYKKENITKSNESYKIELVLPGISKDRLSIDVKESILKVSKDSKLLYDYKLKDINIENITAELINGILTITLPFKSAVPTPSVKIQIK